MNEKTSGRNRSCRYLKGHLSYFPSGHVDITPSADEKIVSQELIVKVIREIF
jgi:hypothetical protein